MEFHIDNMTCGGCARSVTKAIQAVDPQATVEINLDAKSVQVSTKADRARITAMLEDVGYPPNPI
jgi:copper chaperone